MQHWRRCSLRQQVYLQLAKSESGRSGSHSAQLRPWYVPRWNLNSRLLLSGCTSFGSSGGGQAQALACSLPVMPSGKMPVWLMLAACVLPGLASLELAPLKKSRQSECQTKMKSYNPIPKDLKCAFMEVDEIRESPGKIEADLNKLEHPLKVAVVGCFSSGKSTLINGLVGAKTCKTGKLPVTMNLSAIPYQNGDRIQLIDTMGVDAMDFPEHKEETADAIAKADAVIYAVNAGNLGTNGDGFIGDTLRACNTPGILVVTHWDQVEEIEDQAAIRQAAQKLANDFFPQQDQRPMFFVNAKIAESQNTLKKTVVPSNNGDFAELEECIQTKLADKNTKHLMKLSKMINESVSVCESNVFHRFNQDSIRKRFDDERAQLEAKFQRQRQSTDRDHEKRRKKPAAAKESIQEKLEEVSADLKSNIVWEEVGKGVQVLNPASAVIAAASAVGLAKGIGLAEGVGLASGAGVPVGLASGVGVGAVGVISGVIGGLITGCGKKWGLKAKLENLAQEQRTAEKSLKEIEDEKKSMEARFDKERLRLREEEEKAQEEEARIAQQRRQRLISIFEKHLDIIRELKDNKCL